MDDRPQSMTRGVGLSDTFDDEAVAYRPVSSIAVLGAVLAAASLLALATPWLFFLPVVAAVLCWVAALRVRRDPETQSGMGIAATGLAISLLVLGATVVQRPIASWLHQASAGAVADRFVELIATEDLVGAVELMVPFAERRPTPELAKVLYEGNEEAKKRLEEFSAKEAVQRVAGGETPRLSGPNVVGAMSGRRVVAYLRYDVPARAGKEPATVQVELERSPSGRPGAVAWRVTGFDFPPPPAPSAGG
jgi:hypothetical protein